jgi:hypothetical protein
MSKAVPEVARQRTGALRPRAWVLVASLALAACGAAPDAQRDAHASAPAPEAVAPQAADRASPPATAPQAAPVTSGVQLPASDGPQQSARLDGFGPLRLGMRADDVEAAWPGLLSGTAGALSRRSCFHVGAGDLSHFAMMFDDGRFVRYGGATDEVSAPGGGKRGMAEAELQALYRDGLQSKPDRFARGGKVLSIDASGVAPSRLVFVLRPDGVVNEWYVGLMPYADYDAGCESDA